MPNGYVVTGQNRRRAKAGAAAIAAHGKKTGLTKADGRMTQLSDLLADLMHWAAQSKTGFQSALEKARGLYEPESRGKEEF